MHFTYLIILKLKTQAYLWSFINLHILLQHRVILRTSVDHQNLNQCCPAWLTTTTKRSYFEAGAYVSCASLSKINILPDNINYLPMTNSRKLLDLYKCIWQYLLIFFLIACRVEKQMLQRENDTITAGNMGLS